ncbi:MAG: LamG domain-containing protein, partial [Planctomycetota bacterium]
MGKQAKIMAVLGVLVLCGSVLAQGSGLITHWKFDEGSGTTATDSAGDNNGTIGGNPSWVTSIIGSALGFDGTGDYVDCGSDISLDITDAITIGAWVKRPNFVTDGMIAGKTNGDLRSAGYGLFSYTDGLAFNFYSGTWPWRKTMPRVAIPASEWHHVVGTFDGNNAYLYVDGEQSASLAYDGTIAAATGYSFHISFWRPELPAYFNGTIDEVVIFNRALSAEEIQQLYQGGLPDTVGLEITGPEQIREYSQAQYKAIACYDDNATEEVTKSTQWSVEPTTAASINRGLLRTGRIETAEYLTIYGSYTLGEASGEAEMTVRVSVPVGLEITGPERVRENYTAQYKVVVYYDDGQTMDVTNLALWRVEPDTIASINRGLLRT